MISCTFVVVRLFKILILLSLFLFTGIVWAVSPKPKSRIIVQFHESVNEQQVYRLFEGVVEKATALDVDNKIFVIEWSSVYLTKERLIEKLSTLSKVQNFQNDGIIKFRETTPTDTLFNRQWHLNLIKATKAWDLSRQAANRQGDTIVIAVIDDGLHLNHPDFKNNIWKNHSEVPGNMIDDDSNGYVDDVYGWNFMGQNNDISDSVNFDATHGTPVAGIIGARGNDTTGIAGIMWHVKLMIVTIADTSLSMPIYQSDAIRAYSYVLHQRKLYQNTKGKKGAFVVATNASWGIDDKMPHEAPLWCMIYDSLGKYGVMNVGAVSNNQALVDTKGDLPTLCPSRHLITVGSSTINDQYFSSGYSQQHVDLSAPGVNVFSVKAYNKENQISGDLYRGGYSGTSFAAPMVTAAVGLLHSYACEKFIDLNKSNPEAANLLIRRFILEGVDTIFALQGYTVTGGRLNIAKSMKIMDAYCYGTLNVNSLFLEQLSLYPNPGNGLISFSIMLPLEELTINVVNMQGQSQSFAIVENQIQLQTNAEGCYFIQLMYHNKSYGFKYMLINN
jgi:hypothetical protein